MPRQKINDKDKKPTGTGIILSKRKGKILGPLPPHLRDPNNAPTKNEHAGTGIILSKQKGRIKIVGSHWVLDWKKLKPDFQQK